MPGCAPDSPASTPTPRLVPFSRAPLPHTLPSHIRSPFQPYIQWTGHSDADATGLQLRTLQRTLERLMSGEIAKVESNWLQKLTMNHSEVSTAKRWKAALPHMFVWMDYTSIPQPTAGALEQSMIPQEVRSPPQPLLSLCLAPPHRLSIFKANTLHPKHY